MADNVYNLKFTLSNGDVLDAGQIVAPQGAKGDKGDKGDPGTGGAYANTSETIELTSTYTSLNTLCSDILTNKTKVSYVAYSKISGITSLVIPAGAYGATNGYLYFKVVSNGRVVSTGATTSENTERFIEVFYADIYTGYDGRRLTGLLSCGAYGSATDWYFSGWVDPVNYSSSNAININNRTLASKVYVWINNQNGEFWQIDSSGIVRYYQGQIRDRVLISGTNGNTKTINGESIYGTGDITVDGGKTYYRHLITLGTLLVQLTGNFEVTFEVIDTRSTKYTTVQEFISAHPSYWATCVGGHIKDTSGDSIDNPANIVVFPASYGSSVIKLYKDVTWTSAVFQKAANAEDVIFDDTIKEL